MKLKLAVLALFMSLSFVVSSYGADKDAATDGVKTVEQMFVITDFEDSSMPLRLYNGPETPIKAEYTTEEKYEGKQSVKVTTKTKDWSGIEMPVANGKGDWSMMRKLKMWIMGSGAGYEIKVVIEDSQKEQFTYSIFDDFKGWKQVSIPISGFSSRTDWQNDDAITNQKIDYPVKFLHFFTANKGDFTLYYDLITVTDEGKKKTSADEVDEEFAPRVKTAYPLKHFTSDYNLVMGAAVTVPELRVPVIKETLVKEYDSITAGNEMKFYTIRKEKDKYNFGPADELVGFAVDNKLKMRGHTLVWHNSMPEWLEKGTWTKEQLLDLLKEYITTVVKRYKGKLYCWDVVNEVLEEDGAFRGGGTSVWYRVCGQDYIEKAFVWAHEADPDAMLFINDYNIETVNKKSTGLYNLVKKLLAAKVPVNGIGMQMHLIEEDPPNMLSVYDNVKRFTDLGLDVHFTELDIRIKNPSNEAKLKHQAEMYADIVNIGLNFEKVTNITTWGVSDKYSWIPSVFPGYANALVFDKYCNPKPAYYSIEIALQTGPVKVSGIPDYSGRHIVAPFKAIPCVKLPVIDAQQSSGEWNDAIVYPFAYNQANPADQRLPDRKDLDGTWRLMYQGDTLYGLVERYDDVTVTNNKDSAANDNVEICFGIDDDFVCLRTVVGRDFENNDYKGKRKAMWSKNGSVLEFSVQLPPGVLDSKIIGWNIALSDSDGKNKPIRKIYPVPGDDTGSKGLGFGELAFVSGDADAARLGNAHIIPSFKAVSVGKVPVIDGKIESGEWDAGVSYQLSYNQLNKKNLTAPNVSDLYADWRIVYSGKTIYGMVKRADDVTVVNEKNPAENDAVEIFFDLNEVFMQLKAPVGSGFEQNSYKGKTLAAWNDKGNVFEFSIELPADDLKGLVAGWDIAVSDNDNKKAIDVKLYPVNGENLSWTGEELAEIGFK